MEDGDFRREDVGASAEDRVEALAAHTSDGAHEFLREQEREKSRNMRPADNRYTTPGCRWKYLRVTLIGEHSESVAAARERFGEAGDAPFGAASLMKFRDDEREMHAAATALVPAGKILVQVVVGQ
jgi:hypothetical protein